MRKGKEVIGLPILGRDVGKRLAAVRELILDPKQRRVLGFLVEWGGILSEAKVVPFRSAMAVGRDAIIVQNEQAIVRASEVPEIEEALKVRATLAGLRVFTEDGRDIGTIEDVFFDETTGELKGFEVSKGVLDRVRGRRAFVPLTPALLIGPEVVFVPSEVAAKVGEAEGRPGWKEMRVGGEELLKRAREEAERLREMAMKATVEQQKRFVVSKVADRPVIAADGTVIARQGEVIDEHMAFEAERKGVLVNLVLAAGTRVAREAAERLRREAARAVEGVRKRDEPAKSSSHDPGEERRIHDILGRPVNRMILDQNERVILNAGEMVTHEAIDRARQAGMLEELLGAVSKEEPRFTVEERRHTPGQIRRKRAEEARGQREE